MYIPLAEPESVLDLYVTHMKFREISGISGSLN